MKEARLPNSVGGESLVKWLSAGSSRSIGIITTRLVSRVLVEAPVLGKEFAVHQN